MAQASDPINVREARAILAHLEAILAAGSERERDAAIGEGIVAWGNEFISALSYAAERSPVFHPIRDKAEELHQSWLSGKALTRRADEDERRALAATALAERAPGLARLAVLALRKLPEQHPLRRARMDSALALLSRHGQAGDHSARLSATATMLASASSREQADALIREGEELLRQATGTGPGRTFRIAAGGTFARRSIEARDRGDQAAMRALARRARQFIDPVVDDLAAERDSYGLSLSGFVHEIDDDLPGALELYLQALGSGVADERRRLTLSGVLRTGALVGRHDQVLRFAHEALDALVALYATEPDPRRAAEYRVELDRALNNVGLSCAATDDRAMLLWALEATGSARLRHRMTIRAGRQGPRIRRLEAALWSAERGLGSEPAAVRRTEGRAARSLTVTARLREAHRIEARRQEQALKTPDPRDVVARLPAGHGVAVLGTGQWGTAVLLLRGAGAAGGPGGMPEGTILDKPLSSWLRSLGPESPPGWAYVVGAPWEYDGMPGADRRTALRQGLLDAEADVGPYLAEWAGRHTIRTLWLVPHGLLGLLPWWAVPSLSAIDVRPVPALALLPRARGWARLAEPAVLLGNATGDLPAAEAEVNAVADRLRRRGLPAAVLPADTTEDAVVAATSGARILHFSGHATSELTDSTRSALHLRPDARWSAPEIAGELRSLAATARWSEPADGVRTAEVEPPRADGRARPGLLREETLGAVTLRHLEHSPTGTLLAAYVGDRLVRLAELWSAGDMAVSGTLRDLRLAVLSACQSGGGGLDLGSDEFGGLPAAMMLAGVRSIVCTAWTVDDVLSAVSADLFWELLCSRRNGVVDLYLLVRQVRSRLAGMTAEEVSRRVHRLRSFAPAGRTRFLLEAAAARLEPDRPYGHEYDWAPLFVVGEPLVAWRRT
ncbi:CHAT domain-containing protein [Nonomuraea jiangxiensis]|uniref:CHAT domain-containing protein n=1 Tax=Nonomuraea jiangxiensis TaxID=633440 RepID=A0A1G9P7D8_9ACTN|nr:CHAT domain-containing protein [Nonomuraea jiangxiensis]SDL94075.1 CHAT domain-containing protein [Nonomuraea jiangxiensis]